MYIYETVRQSLISQIKGNVDKLTYVWFMLFQNINKNSLNCFPGNYSYSMVIENNKDIALDLGDTDSWFIGPIEWIKPTHTKTDSNGYMDINPVIDARDMLYI